MSSTVPNDLPLPLFLVSPAPLTMMLTPQVPQALQLFTRQADADKYAGQFPHTRRKELTTPAAVAELLRSPPGWHNMAIVTSSGEATRYELADLAKKYEAQTMAAPAAPPSPPASPPPPATTPAMPEEEDELRRLRVQAYLREVQNS